MNIVKAINAAALEWGISCMRYEIRDISPPKVSTVATYLPCVFPYWLTCVRAYLLACRPRRCAPPWSLRQRRSGRAARSKVAPQRAILAS